MDLESLAVASDDATDYFQIDCRPVADLIMRMDAAEIDSIVVAN